MSRRSVPTRTRTSRASGAPTRETYARLGLDHVAEAVCGACAAVERERGNAMDEAGLAATLAELAVDTVPLNFLNPIPGTPLQDTPLLTPHDALKSVALFRLMLPDAGITIAGGRERVLGDYQSWLPLAGANGIMIGNYLTTRGRDLETDLRMLEQGTWI